MGAGGQDPLGKRALFRLPVEERTIEPVLDVGREDRAAGPGVVRRARAAGKHALYSVATPVWEPRRARPVSEPDRLPARGLLVVACSACGDARRIGLARFAMLHVPVAAWVPGRRFDRWVTCPSCRRRTWVSVTRAR